MKFIVPIIIFAASICAPANARMQSDIRRIAETEPLKSSVWGMLAVKGRDTIAEHNSGKRMLPASNMKLITTGTALHELGEDFRFETGIAHSGKIEDGVLRGDIYIIGGADPTLASDDSAADPSDKLFARWKFFIERAGIRKIEGKVIGDGRIFTDNLENDSWEYYDLGTYYSTGASGLMFYENTQEFYAEPGTAEGEPAKVVPLYPQTPWMEFTDFSVTGPAGSGDNLYLFVTDMAPVGEMRGSLAMDSRPKKEACANKFAAMTCAAYFAGYLETNGIAVSGGYADIDRKGFIRDFMNPGPRMRAEAKDNLTMLGSTFSPALSEIIRETNHRSDNLYAETLYRTIGLKRTGSSCYDSCNVAIFKALEDMGATGLHGFSPKDGSGLSRQNNVSPAFMVEFLETMRGTEEFGAYLSSLPSPGEGTLTSLLRQTGQPVKDRIFIKSGSMNGVLCYSGYILPSDGKPENTIVFSLLTNNGTAALSRVRAELEKIILFLAEQN